ncbi:unnamed protein product [Mytilus coruscus]|uniref:Uncharacterized protein n=1 Tax=Mytilus coruscus TaxID=42192 RepID=A0A6J8CX40_MYTCO|nr:unnamed protein product [Mytilus coruscus]
MDDSDVILFKPHLDNREGDEEMLPENNFESSLLECLEMKEQRIEWEVGPKSINEAENIAIRLKALRVADIHKGRNVRIVYTETIQEHELNREINEIKQSIGSLTSEVIIIKNQNGQQFRGDDNYRRNQNNFNRNFNNRWAFLSRWTVQPTCSTIDVHESLFNKPNKLPANSVKKPLRCKRRLFASEVSKQEIGEY